MYNSQEVVNVIKSTAKEQNKPIGKMLEDCELSKNALSSMQQGYFPRIENIVKIADYLSCSIDTLLGREQKNNAPGDVRSVIISKVKSLPDDKLDRLLGYLEALAQE